MTDDLIGRLRALAEKEPGYGMAYHAKGLSGAAELHLYGKRAEAAHWLMLHGPEALEVLRPTVPEGYVLVKRETLEPFAQAADGAEGLDDGSGGVEERCDFCDDGKEWSEHLQRRVPCRLCRGSQKFVDVAAPRTPPSASDASEGVGDDDWFKRNSNLRDPHAHIRTDPEYFGQECASAIQRGALVFVDPGATPVLAGEEAEAETYRQMHDIAKGLGYPSILEALEACSPAAAIAGEEALREALGPFAEMFAAVGRGWATSQTHLRLSVTHPGEASILSWEIPLPAYEAVHAALSSPVEEG
jgi:hypothetical protein